MAEVVETLALSENRSLSRNIRRLNYRGAVSTTIQFVFHPHRHPQRRFFKWRNHTPRYSCKQTTPHPYRTRADRDYILALKAYQERLPIYCTGDAHQRKRYNIASQKPSSLEAR